MKDLNLKLVLLALVTSFSINTLADELEKTIPAENGPELSPKDMSATNWDEVIDKKVKKRRGFKKVADRLDELGDKGTEALDKLFSRLDQISIEFSVKDKIEIIDGLDFRGGYEYEAGPAFYGNYFQRVDGYRVGFEFSFLDLLDIESDFGIRAQPEVEVRFMQFFDDITEARKPNNGYLPTKVPVTAEAARDLKPGDLVMIDGRLNFSYGIGKVWDKILDWLSFNLRASSHVNGLFRAFVFKGNDDMVRLRVSALRDSPKVISGKFSVFDLFDLGWGKLTELVERALKLQKLVEGQRQWIDRDLWIADYTLDLSDGDVADAYDLIFEREGRYRGIMKLANPFGVGKARSAVVNS